MPNQRVILTDQHDPDGLPPLGVTIEITGDGICIRPDGHGDAFHPQGEGWPILLELYDGDVRVYVWGDINSEDPTDEIILDGAREENRED